MDKPDRKGQKYRGQYRLGGAWTMVSQSTAGITSDIALLQIATKVARDKCQLQKSQIADRAGMSLRMLHRLTSGATRATDSQRDRILVACNLPSATSRLLAEIDHIDLVGTPSQDWLEGFLKRVVSNLAAIRAENGADVDGRWAVSDADLIFSRWCAVMDRRRKIVVDYLPGEWSGTFPDHTSPRLK